MIEFVLSSSYCHDKKLEEAFFKEAKANGFNNVELVLLPGHFRNTRDEVSLVKKIVSDYQIKVASIHCDFEVLAPPSLEVFKKAKEVVLSNLDLVAELGGRFLVVHNYIFADPETVIVDEDGTLHPGLSLLRDLKDENSGMLERIKSGMAFYSHEAKKRGVSIALETEQNAVNDKLLDFISKADQESCGICFDAGHAQIASDAVKTANLLAPRVICTHLHDNDGKKDLHLPPFTGIIDWENLLMELVKGGYKGRYTFECGGDMADIVKARQKFMEILNK